MVTLIMKHIVKHVFVQCEFAIFIVNNVFVQCEFAITYDLN